MDHDNPDCEHEIDLTALEQRLAAWRPAAAALDRDRMLFDAGRAAAEADSHARAWRRATAALALAVIGLVGLLAQERSLLERARSERRALGKLLAVQTGTPAPAPAMTTPSVVSAEVEPLAPTSYFALTSRLTKAAPDTSAPDAALEPEPHRPVNVRSGTLSNPGALQLRDFPRSRDL
jgi:hypothetical protein